MKRMLAILLAFVMLLTVQTAAAQEAKTVSPPDGGYDLAMWVRVGQTKNWTPFGDAGDVRFSSPTLSRNGLPCLSLQDNGTSVAFTGANAGWAELWATAGDGRVLKAFVAVGFKRRKKPKPPAEGGGTWTLRIDEAAAMDIMGLAKVDYDLDLTATHTGPDMFGEYKGELGMVYSADLGSLQSMMEMAGISFDYETDGWFKNTDFRMELAKYSDADETRFVDSLKDPNISEEERALVSQYMGSMFGEVGSGDKGFETANKPAGLWFDWAFHMTEGDMSAYVSMTGAMFTASASQNATAQTAEGYVDTIFTSPYHNTLSYKDEAPFPYQIEVYESGEAVFTLRNPTESPIVVKFYGTLTKN
jgi:hypothetical protein